VPIRDQDQLRSYVARIARSAGGMEGLVDRLRTTEELFVPEGMEAPARAEPGATGGKVRASGELAAAAKTAAEKLAQGGRDLTRIEVLATEAIIIPDKRPAFDIVDGDFVADHELWLDLSKDAAIHARLCAAIPLVGRIELPGQKRIPYGGTGFVVGRGLLMTNRHVAEIFATGLGDRRINFRSGWRAAANFKAERGRPNGPYLEVRAVRMIHPWWDMALLEVPDLPGSISPLRLAVRDSRDLAGARIAVIGYPARDPLRNDPAVQDQLFERVFQVKRLQPGEIDGGQATASFGHMVQAATHDCSTLGGNSGSAIIDLGTGEVLGLHFGGLYLDTNYAVPSIELGRDARVVDAGVTLAGPVPGGYSAEQAKRWQEIELVGGTDHQAVPAPLSTPEPKPTDCDSARPPQYGPEQQPQPARVTFEVPLHITVELGSATTIAAASASAAARATEAVPVDTAERMVEPRHDKDYRGRRGYDADFLGHVRVPMPKPRNARVLARTKMAGTKLDYQNFSILMHAERRLALMTACNITREAKSRQPEPGRDYGRKGLGGLGKNDSERWFEDTRLDSRFQLPEVFFTRDGGAFDKGHLVRREDVAWGRDYEAIVRANGDTFHVTNCSPQVAQFNQSVRGEDNWGDLENLLLGEAAQERLCLFCGPVLDPADQTFVGVGEGGRPLRLRIPSRYWKVVVSATAEWIAAYGFVLEQDLSGLELEFAVPENFRRLQVPLTEIEDAAGIDLGDALREADAWGSEAAQEMAERAGLVRTESLAPAESEMPTPNVGDDEDAEEGDRTAPESETEALPAWRVAKVLLVLRRQVDACSPRRNKANDGTIGDAAHRSRNSDHNPWVRDGAMGVVTAIDITNDPTGGCDADRLAKAILGSRDRRVKYVIWNHQIANSSAIGGSPAWTWRPYRGTNPHDHHVHISVKPEKAAYDDEEPWKV
jgi:endonuclease G